MENPKICKITRTVIGMPDQFEIYNTDFIIFLSYFSQINIFLSLHSPMQFGKSPLDGQAVLDKNQMFNHFFISHIY